MDIPTTMTPIQLLLIWLLMGFLIAWMVVFALLALRPERGKVAEAELLSSSSSSLPQLHVLVQKQVEKPAISIQLEATTASNARS